MIHNPITNTKTNRLTISSDKFKEKVFGGFFGEAGLPVPVDRFGESDIRKP
jgi:hypothetical protein